MPKKGRGGGGRGGMEASTSTAATVDEWYLDVAVERSSFLQEHYGSSCFA